MSSTALCSIERSSEHLSMERSRAISVTSSCAEPLALPIDRRRRSRSRPEAERGSLGRSVRGPGTDLDGDPIAPPGIAGGTIRDPVSPRDDHLGDPAVWFADAELDSA